MNQPLNNTSTSTAPSHAPRDRYGRRWDIAQKLVALMGCPSATAAADTPMIEALAKQEVIDPEL
jgi:hypothetical protein